MRISKWAKHIIERFGVQHSIKYVALKAYHNCENVCPCWSSDWFCYKCKYRGYSRIAPLGCEEAEAFTKKINKIYILWNHTSPRTHSHLEDLFFWYDGMLIRRLKRKIKRILIHEKKVSKSVFQYPR